MTRIESAIVVGGGIAGPAAALALQKIGVRATVYEGYAASAEGIGGTLMVAPNGLNALGVIGLQDAVSAIGQPIERMVMADGRGKQLMEFPGLAGLPPSRLMWRSDIYRVMRDQALARGVNVQYGKRLVGVQESEHAITATFTDGSSATADVLIGADGIHSTVRKLIDPNAPEPLPDGLIGCGGEADLSLPGRPDAIYFVFGKRAFLGYWIQPDGRVAWFTNMPHKEFMSHAEARAVPSEVWRERALETYAGDYPAEQLVRHTPADRLVAFGSTDMLPEVPRWYRGRMVLVGDSAHAPNHSSGQGVSLAVESAVELARCLRDIDDPTTAFATFEQLRRPRVKKIAEQAARTNQHKSAGPIATAMMSLFMRIATRTFMKPEKMFGWVQGYRIEWDQPAGPTAQPRGSKVLALSS